MTEFKRMLCPIDFSYHRAPSVDFSEPSTADDMAADLIVIGVHGRNAVGLTLFGSTTNHVVRRAACPVLTIRATK